MSRTSISVTNNGTTLNVRASIGTPCNKWDMWRYKHTITIGKDGVKSTFSFYGSHIDYCNGKDTLDTDDLMQALQYIISDAMYYYNAKDANDFAKELCYENPIEAWKVYMGCCRTFRSLTDRLGLAPDELYDFENICRNYEEARC